MTLMEGMRHWLGGRAPAEDTPAASVPAAAAPAASVPRRAAGARAGGPAPLWTEARIAVTDSLWGDGFLFPGGEDEVLHLARPLGLTAAASLLLLGAGAGGPSRAIATRLGIWVSGFEADPYLAAIAAERSVRAGLGRRAPVAVWDPANPTFRKSSHHHGMALEPLHGAQPEPVLAATCAALKSGGQLVLTELVGDTPLEPTDPAAAAWARLENRTLALPTEDTITRNLGRLGFDVRVVEDISQRHIQLASLGWRQALAAITGKPSPEEAAVLVREAEQWLLRLRLIRVKKMRLVRWHAIAPGSPAAPG